MILPSCILLQGSPFLWSGWIFAQCLLYYRVWIFVVVVVVVVVVGKQINSFIQVSILNTILFRFLLFRIEMKQIALLVVVVIGVKGGCYLMWLLGWCRCTWEWVFVLGASAY